MTVSTVSAVDPCTPSDVAVIVAIPETTPATRPLPFTVATDPSLVPQVAEEAPATVLPFASCGSAVS